MRTSLLVFSALIASAVRAADPIDISTGRQLFVDDFLVSSVTGVVRHWNRPVKAPDPVVWPADTYRDGQFGQPGTLTCATDGGLWWDPTRGKYRLWYQVGWLGELCYAESADGVAWTYPDLGKVKGTNRVFGPKERPPLDSWSVTPDYAAANPYVAWRLHISAPGNASDDTLFASADGLTFARLGVAGQSGDRSTSYYDPFRGVWVFSLRDYRKESGGRCRRYFASAAFGGESCRWCWPHTKWPGVTASIPESFARCPEPEPWLSATNGLRRSLYSFNAVAYESLMLGVMEILYNTPHDNNDGARVGLPKQTGLHFCFSRDGKTYEPRTTPDIAPGGWGSGKWDTGYLACVGGICTVSDDTLRFYYSGLRGDGRKTKTVHWKDNGMYDGGAIGYATLRRDGFAGMVADGAGALVTKPLVFTGGRLFVNAECRFGELTVDVLDENGAVVPGLSAADCAPIVARDATKAEIAWKGGTLASRAGKPTAFRFNFACSTLYSFWVTSDAKGRSGGYVAAGGPAYAGLRDR